MAKNVTKKVLPHFEVPSGPALYEEPRLSKLVRHTVTFMFDKGDRVVDLTNDRIGTVTEITTKSGISVRFDGSEGGSQFRLSSLDQLALLHAFDVKSKSDDEEVTEEELFQNYQRWKLGQGE